MIDADLDSAITVVALHVWPEGVEEPIRESAVEVDFAGLPGDRHYGSTMLSDSRTSRIHPKGVEIRNHRQLSLVGMTELAEVAANLGISELAPGVIADNIALAGVDNLTALPRLTRLEFESGAVLMTGGENTPCVIAGRMVAARYGTRPASFPKAAIRLRGITAWVDRPGRISVGDAVRTHPPG
jgi:MOSC domain-containing protein YiiM